MPDNGYIALLVLVSSAITWALRALPFAALAPLRGSRVVKFSRSYTLRTVVGDTSAQVLWLVIAVAVTAGLHLWRGTRCSASSSARRAT